MSPNPRSNDDNNNNPILFHNTINNHNQQQQQQQQQQDEKVNYEAIDQSTILRSKKNVSWDTSNSIHIGQQQKSHQQQSSSSLQPHGLTNNNNNNSHKNSVIMNGRRSIYPNIDNRNTNNQKKKKRHVTTTKKDVARINKLPTKLGKTSSSSTKPSNDDDVHTDNTQLSTSYDDTNSNNNNHLTGMMDENTNNTSMMMSPYSSYNNNYGTSAGMGMGMMNGIGGMMMNSYMPSPYSYGGGGGLFGSYGGGNNNNMMMDNYPTGPVSNFNSIVQSINTFVFGIQSLVFTAGQAVTIINMNTSLLQQLFDNCHVMIDTAITTWHEMRMIENNNIQQYNDNDDCNLTNNNERDEKQRRIRRIRMFRWTLVTVSTYVSYTLIRKVVQTIAKLVLSYHSSRQNMDSRPIMIPGTTKSYRL